MPFIFHQLSFSSGSNTAAENNHKKLYKTITYAKSQEFQLSAASRLPVWRRTAPTDNRNSQQNRHRENRLGREKTLCQNKGGRTHADESMPPIKKGLATSAVEGKNHPKHAKERVPLILSEDLWCPGPLVLWSPGPLDPLVLYPLHPGFLPSSS